MGSGSGEPTYARATEPEEDRETTHGAAQWQCRQCSCVVCAAAERAFFKRVWCIMENSMRIPCARSPHHVILTHAHAYICYYILLSGLHALRVVLYSVTNWSIHPPANHSTACTHVCNAPATA